jgi:threonine/homoserine/homoserine lactone efflux protein
MTEILITISIAGLIAGFIFSMPIAGPVSILVTSNALNGRFRNCMLITIGASFADFIYVFIAVYGLSSLYNLYRPAVPYLIGAGALFIIIVGLRIFLTKIDLENIDNKVNISQKIKKGRTGAFYTGLLVNLFNPTIFFGWLSTSFIVISIVSSLGFNTGGLDYMINNNISDISSIENKRIEKPQVPSYLQFDTLQILKKESFRAVPEKISGRVHLLIACFFAFFISLGSIVWFYLLSFLMVRFRSMINIRIIGTAIKGMGIVLCFFGIYFCFRAIKMII